MKGRVIIGADTHEHLFVPGTVQRNISNPHPGVICGMILQVETSGSEVLVIFLKIIQLGYRGSGVEPQAV